MRVTVGRIDQFASANEIKAAYKKLSLQLHPDKLPAAWSLAKAAFQRVGDAHEQLQRALGGGAPGAWQPDSPAARA